MQPKESGATWAELSYHVLEELKRLDARCDENGKLSRANEKGLLVLKTKAWAFGLLAGAVASIAVKLVLEYLGKTP